MNTHCDYKISSIVNDGNSVTVTARFFEGIYENVLINEITTIQYIRKISITEPAQIFFEKNPVTMDEIKAELKEMLLEESNLEVIPEC